MCVGLKVTFCLRNRRSVTNVFRLVTNLFWSRDIKQRISLKTSTKVLKVVESTCTEVLRRRRGTVGVETSTCSGSKLTIETGL